MKIHTSTKTDLLATTSTLTFHQDETSLEAPDITFIGTKLRGELVEFTVKTPRETIRTFSWSIVRAHLLNLRANPQVVAMAGTMAAPLISLDKGD